MSGEFLARTAIWIVALALWTSLNKANDVGFFPRWSGVPSVIGCVLIVAGIGLYAAGAVSLAHVKRDSVGTPTKLLTHGPYSYVRNPVYLGIGIIVGGLMLLYQAWQFSTLMKTVILFTAAHLAVVFLEEPATRKRFGATYDEYCRRVPRWLPRRPSN